jgi:hypothetical protein
VGGTRITPRYAASWKMIPTVTRSPAWTAATPWRICVRHQPREPSIRRSRSGKTANAPRYDEIRIATSDGRRLAAWYVPSRNGAAVLVGHGSGGSRGRVAAHVRMLARHGYGVLALRVPRPGLRTG